MCPLTHHLKQAAVIRAARRKPVAVGRYVRLLLRVPTRARSPAASVVSLLPAAWCMRDDGTPASTGLVLASTDDVLSAGGSASVEQATRAIDDGSVSTLLAICAALAANSVCARDVFSVVSSCTPCVQPFVVAGLLRHERKLTICNYK
jgi:hypothetical protein